MKKRQILWSANALEQLTEINSYLEENASVLVAEKVRKKILTSTKILGERPERYAPDGLKQNNDGSYRYYKVYNYRISYRILEDTIRIIRVRHTKQEPKDY